MPSSTRSNKETQLLFSSDHQSLERSIRKEICSSSIDNNTCSSLDFRQPPSTQTLVSSTYTRSPPSTEDTHLPSTDIFHPTSIDTSVRTSIDTEPRDMVATLILVRDERGDLHDQEGHLRNAAGSPEHRSMTPTESTASCNDKETAIDRQPPAPIDRRAPLTYRVQMPKIDVARLNALRPKPKPSDDAADPMEVDRVPMGRTLRKRKEKVVKHLKRGANEKERESFQKRVFMISLEKPFEEAYFTHRLWMFFRETRETEEDIRRMFCEAREKMKKRITVKKKSDPEQFAIPCGAFQGIIHFCRLFSEELMRSCERPRGADWYWLVRVDFHVLDIKLNWNSSLLLGRAFLSRVGAMCNLQTNQLCLTLIACHCGTEYETEYSVLIETHTATSIDNTQKKSINVLEKELIDSSPEHWENDYYNPTMAAHTRHTMHTEEYDEDYEEDRATEIVSTSIDTHPNQASQKRASTDIAYFPSVDIGVDRVREGDYSIGSWADDHHHECYEVETTIHESGADELHEGFTYEELLNMQRRDEADQQRAEATEERTRLSYPIDRTNRPSIDNNLPPLIDIRPKPKFTISENPNYDNNYLTQDKFGIFRDLDGYAREIDGHALQVSREDIADILQTANGANNLFMQQRTVPAHHKRVTKELYDTTGGIDNRFKKFYWEEKDEYGVYRDDQGCARDVDGHIINVSKDDIRKLMERPSRDEHNYIRLPEHASSFTQTKLVPEIYTKDEINEMFYGVCGAQEKYEELHTYKQTTRLSLSRLNVLTKLTRSALALLLASLSSIRMVSRKGTCPNSTRSNKETQLLFSSDPASLERSIRKEIRSSSIDNNTCLSLDFCEPSSTQTLVSSTDTCSPPSTEETNLPSTDIFHPTSIDTSVRTSIDTEPRDMVTTLILVRNERGDLHDQEGHLRNAAGQKIDAQGAAIPESYTDATGTTLHVDEAA
ncbi:hypothetical protein F2Q70_00035924 [Brassica cretica]|uniref:Uncharacterized protein n=1 Tax=Brassica cretica TaxID=69181 RepID=A0A8S9JYM3_BRACR|nr:hypothetical protein F2Q70_00035924 [Brassica cretica]